MRYDNVGELKEALKMYLSKKDGITDNNSRIKHNKERKLDLSNLTIPGFRTKGAIKKCVAIIGYLCIVGISFSVTFESSDSTRVYSSFEIVYLKLCCLIWLLSIVTLETNYLNVWNVFPGLKNPRPIREIIVFLYSLVVFVVVEIVFLLINSIVSSVI